MRIETVLTPADIARLPTRQLESSICVVFDVLRATSTAITALAHGARRFIPVDAIEHAREMAAQIEGALLAGERGGQAPPGFDKGNSPLEFLEVAGRDIVSTTTNGTVALRACEGARMVLAGAFLNLGAAAAFLDALRPERVLLVCAGTGEDLALEDALAAGELAAMLHPPVEVCDATRALLALASLPLTTREALLLSSANARALTRAGRGEDVSWCMQRDRFPILPVMQAGALVVRSASELHGAEFSAHHPT